MRCFRIVRMKIQLLQKDIKTRPVLLDGALFFAFTNRAGLGCYEHHRTGRISAVGLADSPA